MNMERKDQDQTSLVGLVLFSSLPGKKHLIAGIYLSLIDLDYIFLTILALCTFTLFIKSLLRNTQRLRKYSSLNVMFLLHQYQYDQLNK